MFDNDDVDRFYILYQSFYNALPLYIFMQVYTFIPCGGTMQT